jgi:glycosyltransferase involved in cell wall biosynthesis
MNQRDEDAYLEYSDAAELVERPDVSVIMPTYNHKRFLAEAIEGVVRQETSFAVELLIGEDCSTDGTIEIALEYQKRFPKTIRVITSEQNVGGDKNFGRLIAAARGIYLAFCDGDDFWHRPDKLQLQIDHFRADDSIVCVSAEKRNVLACGEVAEGQQSIDLNAKPIIVEYEDIIFDRILHPTCTVVARTWAVRRAYSGASLCNDRSMPMGDLPLWLEMSQLGRMIHLPEVLASYRLSSNSATRQGDPLWSLYFLMCAHEIRYRALEKYPLPGDERQTSQAKLELVRRLLRGAARIGDRAVARCQWRRLSGLGSRATLSDVACMAIAFTPFPRRSLAVKARKIGCYLKKRGCKRGRILGPLWLWFAGYQY